MDRSELLAKIPEQLASRGPYQGIVARLSPEPFEPFNEELLAPFIPDLHIVVSAQTGYNDFDVDWMTRQGVYFCNSKYATSEATAEMALFLIFAVLRNTSLGERNLREGLWRSGIGLGRDPAGMTLGIVGMGKVGEKLARKATAAFGMRVAYWNQSGRRVSSVQPWDSVSDYRHCEKLDELLQCSDVVSLHCPLTTATTMLMSQREFGLMRDGSFFINTSRGALVDDTALIEALETGKVCRAGLDVFGGEPDLVHPYYRERIDKVVVQPHMGGLTEASFARAAMECFANLRACFETGRPLAPVNDVPRHAQRAEPGLVTVGDIQESRAANSNLTNSKTLPVGKMELPPVQSTPWTPAVRM